MFQLELTAWERKENCQHAKLESKGTSSPAGPDSDSSQESLKTSMLQEYNMRTCSLIKVVSRAPRAPLLRLLSRAAP